MVGVRVDVGVKEGVHVAVAVFVGRGVKVDVFVIVGRAVRVAVGVNVFVGVNVTVNVGVREGVMVCVGVKDKAAMIRRASAVRASEVLVAFISFVADGVGLGVFEAVNVAVGVLDGV